ncbi:MAG TPA: tetraacyldisaccharide 4'-kinase [Pyrinomonadaceae bacterium]|nr:tetraacyldisaccharide 4'-kinase [Pyrinomonadaceae bacterium]
MNPVAPIVLPPLSALYGFITRTRLSMYRRGTFRTTKLTQPVISVGNITTGGTGKTPLVEWIARTLANKGRKVAVLTRGYGRERPNDRVLVSDGLAVFSNPEQAGDEAFLLAANLKGAAAVISDANRISAAYDAVKHLHTNCFVLDDGFQHLRLARDLDVVTIDATNPWGGGRLLPEGRLREPLTGLSRADCFVLTRADQTDDISSIQQELRRFSASPVFTSRMKTRVLTPLNEVGTNLAAPVGAFCGIGNPQSFFTHVQREGYNTVFQKALRDHQPYSQQLIDSITIEAEQSGARTLLTTAKDAVKLRSLNLRLPILRLDVEISIDDEPGFRQLILNALKA